MVALQFEFDPSISETVNELLKVDKTLINQLGASLKTSALEFNKGVKKANPAKTGHSRRAWGAPIQIAPTTFVVKNDAQSLISSSSETNKKGVYYTPLIKYGKKKKSRWVATPQGVTINPGKSFKLVADEYFEVVAEKLAKRIDYLLSGAW